jgi:hypothetical protein
VSISVTLAVVSVAWLLIAGFFVALCRMAHGVHGPTGKPSASARSAHSAAVPHTIAAGLVVWEQEPPDLERELRKLMLRGRGAPTRGARSAA